jgi:hypothetical protein
MALLLLATPAAAYIPSVGSLFKRAVAKADDIDRSRGVTLRGTITVGDAAPLPATLQLRFPNNCRLQTESEKSPAAVAVRGSPLEPEVEEEGQKLGAARELLTLACPLLTFKGSGRGTEGERTLRTIASAAGAPLQPTTLARLGERPVYVIGAQPRQLEVPQLWLYKEELAPARLLARRDAGLLDLRLLEYGTPASAVAFPRVIELWRGDKLAARFEALEAGSRSKSAASEDDDRE